MSERFVIDASVGLAWIHPAQATRATDQLLRRFRRGVRLAVPGLWFLEVANALLVLERRKKMTRDERHEALAVLQLFNTCPDYESAGLAFGKITELAETQGLSVYDAAYLELALREQLPLATKDTGLQAAAARCGVHLLLK